jgi:protein TonB
VFAKTFAQIAASVLLHGSIIGAIVAFSSISPVPEERAYRVALAEFSAPATPTAVPGPPLPQPEPKKPENSEPVIEPPKPNPLAERASEPKVKNITTKKATEKKKPAGETQPAASPSPPAPAQAASADLAGPTLHIGDLAAYDADAVDQRPSIAGRIVPEYPHKAQRLNIQGKVFVRLVVDTSGRPKECVIHQADPAGYFEDAALAAARKTRFIPGMVKGQPVNTVVLVPFVFTLR